MNRITVNEAAALLQIPAQAVRVLMQKGELPIGFLYGDGKKFVYVIYRERVEDFMKGAIK